MKRMPCQRGSVEKALVHQRSSDAADEYLVCLAIGDLERKVDRLRDLRVLEAKTAW